MREAKESVAKANQFLPTTQTITNLNYKSLSLNDDQKLCVPYVVSLPVCLPYGHF
jgi:hypothetical protein